MEDEGFSTAVAISIVIGIIIFILAVVLLVLFFCKERGKKFSFFQLSRSFIFFIWFDFFFHLNNPFIIPCWKISIKKVDFPKNEQTSLLWQYYCITLSHWNHHLYPCCWFTCSFILERKGYHIWKLFRK